MRLARKHAKWVGVALVGILHAMLFGQFLSRKLIPEWLEWTYDNYLICMTLVAVWAVWAALSHKNIFVRALVVSITYGVLGLDTSHDWQDIASLSSAFVYGGLRNWGAWLGLPSIALFWLVRWFGFDLTEPATHSVSAQHPADKPRYQFSIRSLCILVLVVAALVAVGLYVQRHARVETGLGALTYWDQAFQIAFPMSTLTIAWLVFGISPLLVRCTGASAILISIGLWLFWSCDWPVDEVVQELDFWLLSCLWLCLMIAALCPFRIAGDHIRRGTQARLSNVCTDDVW